jgi:NAD-dependent dihydropyrimidine dehydrogenase PreA subunit
MKVRYAMAKYEFKAISLDRAELRQSGSPAANELNALGADGWHIVHVKEDPQLYIDPQVCIDCGACVAACPVEAIYADTDVPAKWEKYIEINAEYFENAQGAPAVQQAQGSKTGPAG